MRRRLTALLLALAMAVGLSQFAGATERAQAGACDILIQQHLFVGYYGAAYDSFIDYSTCFTNSFTITGSLPPGIRYDRAPDALGWTVAEFHGTPSAPGTYNFSITVSDGFNSVTQNASITIYGNPSFTAVSPPTAGVNVPYSYTFTANNNATIQLTGGSVPPGLTFTAGTTTATLSGTPTTVGQTQFTVRAANPSNNDTRTITFTVTNLPIFDFGTIPNAGFALAYSFQFHAANAVSYSTSGAFPAGLSFNSSTGLLSGTTSTSNTLGRVFTFTVFATNAAGTSQSQVSITVATPASFTAWDPPSGLVGSAYSYTYQASGFPAPTFTETGTVPGLTFTNGSFSGIPTTGGSFAVVITASTDPSEPPQSIHQNIIIKQSPTTFSNPGPTTWVMGTPWTPIQYSANGYPAPTYSVAAGWGTGLPPGLALSSSGLLTGTPTATGDYDAWVVADNGTGQTFTIIHIIHVYSKPVFINQTPPIASQGQAYSYTYTASGFPAPTFGVLSGTSLPPGLSLSAAGVLSGTPTGSGPYSFKITATNAAGTVNDSSTTVTMMVGSPPVFTAQSPPTTGTVGVSYDSFAFQADGYPSGSLGWGFLGNLPPGFSTYMNNMGGTPTTQGTYTFQVIVGNPYGSTLSNPITIKIYGPPTLTAKSPSATGQVNVPYSYTFAASGTAASSFSYTGALPPGLTLSAGGVLSGTPTTTGTSTFSVVANNGYGTDTVANLTITVAAAGIRTAYIESGQLARVTASTGQQSRTGQLTLQVQDTTNTRLGWSVTVSSSAFGYQGALGGTAIPASAFSISSIGTVTGVNGDAVVTGTDAVPKGPQSAAITTGLFGSLNTTRSVLRAGAGYGTGLYRVPMNVSLTLPAGAKAGLYTSTLTVTIATGP